MMSNGIGNRGGIPFVVATQNNAGSTSTFASYSLPQNTFRFVGSKGLVTVYFSAATAETVQGINIICNEVSLPLLDANSNPITTADIGYHILCFDKQLNTINMLL